MDLASRIGDFTSAHDHGVLQGAELLPKRLMSACAALLPVTASGISIFSRWGHRVPLGASSSSAVAAERLQFTAGEGPCFAAHSRGSMVIAGDHEMALRWPAFHQELVSHTDFRFIVSAPVGAGPSGGAALDFYYDDTIHEPSATDLDDLQAAADAVGALLMETVPADTDLDPELLQLGPAWLGNSSVHSRSLVWIALGMINFGLRMDETDALARLRSYAFGHSTTVDDVAWQMTTQRLPVEALAL